MKNYSDVYIITMDYENDDIGFPIEGSQFGYMDDNYKTCSREVIKHSEGKDLSKYGQFGCRKLNKRNKKKHEFGVVPNSNKC